AGGAKRDGGGGGHGPGGAEEEEGERGGEEGRPGQPLARGPVNQRQAVLDERGGGGRGDRGDEEPGGPRAGGEQPRPRPDQDQGHAADGGSVDAAVEVGGGPVRGAGAARGGEV